MAPVNDPDVGTPPKGASPHPLTHGSTSDNKAAGRVWSMRLQLTLSGLFGSMLALVAMTAACSPAAQPAAPTVPGAPPTTAAAPKPPTPPPAPPAAPPAAPTAA